jgi:hypothetical protein
MKESKIVNIEYSNETDYGDYYLIIKISNNRKIKGYSKFEPMVNDIIKYNISNNDKYDFRNPLFSLPIIEKEQKIRLLNLFEGDTNILIILIMVKNFGLIFINII